MKIVCPVSLGEIIDKITVLRIKQNFINDSKKLNNISNELNCLSELISNITNKELDELTQELQSINQKIWNDIDAIKQMEKKQCFDVRFIELSRNIYKNNDARFLIKNRINETFGSDIKEQKNFEY